MVIPKNMIQPEQVIFSNICICACTCVHVQRISEKQGPNIEREQGDVFANVQGEEGKGQVV